MEIITIGLNIMGYFCSTTFLLFFLTVLSFMLLTRRDAGVPPGPMLVPLLGNLFSLVTKDILSSLARLRRQYGDIYALYIGREFTVFLNGYDVINDALLKKGSLFSRRPVNPFTRALVIYPAILTANDKLWSEQRSFSQRALELLCFKTKSKHIESTILDEAEKLMDKLESLRGPVNPRHYLSMSSANVMSNVLLSTSFDLDDEEFRQFLELIDNNADALPRLMTIINCFPFLVKLPGDILGMSRFYEAVHTWQRIFKKYTLGRRFEGEMNDFVELYMQAITENEALGVSQTLTESQMHITTFDLVIAGSDSSSTTIGWLLLYILHDKELEKRLHLEIDDVIGRDRAPSLEDRPSMPLTQATILEALRIANTAPLAVSHSVPRDVIFRGYLIPKDTAVFVNLNSIMMDPHLWEEPVRFKPERFLSADRKGLDIPKEFIPFSLGPRSCLGETFAKMEIFLYLTTILQRFRLSYSGTDKPPVKGKLGAIYSPEPYEICFIKR